MYSRQHFSITSHITYLLITNSVSDIRQVTFYCEFREPNCFWLEHFQTDRTHYFKSFNIDLFLKNHRFQNGIESAFQKAKNCNELKFEFYRHVLLSKVSI